jgi:hypothetical protein
MVIEMSGADTIREPDTWPDDEVTQPMAILAPGEGDAVCAAWMQRGRELAKRRDQTAREAA